MKFSKFLFMLSLTQPALASSFIEENDSSALALSKTNKQDIINSKTIDFTDYCKDTSSCEEFIKTIAPSRFKNDIDQVINLPSSLWLNLQNTSVESIIINNPNAILAFNKEISLSDAYMAGRSGKDGESPLNNSKVTRIEFENVVIRHAYRLATTLLKSPVESVKLQECSIMFPGFSDVWRVISVNLVKDFQINNSRINDNHLMSISNGRFKNSALRHLDLSRNDITSKGALELIKGFEKSQAASLDLSYNKISNELIIGIARAIKKTSFQSINLEGNLITDTGLLRLLKVLNVDGSSVTQLHCDKNTLVTQGVKQLALDLNEISVSSVSLERIDELLPEAELTEQTIFGFNYGKPKKYLGEWWNWSAGYIWNSNSNQ